MNMNTDTEWLTTTEVAEMCDISDAAVRKRLRMGDTLTHKRCGRRIYVSREALLASDWHLRRR